MFIVLQNHVRKMIYKDKYLDELGNEELQEIHTGKYTDIQFFFLVNIF